MNTQQLIETGKKVTAGTYSQLPIVIEQANGCTVTDTEGKSYLDFVAGIAVNALGYGDPGLACALKQVIDGGITHCSNLYWNTPAIEAASKLTKLSGLEEVFFCNSGAEANEAALKLARKYGHSKKGLNANQIISMSNSFHGRTYGAVTATGQEKYHKGFAPMMPDFSYADFNDLESVKRLVTPRCCAIIVEPIQGEGGIIPASKEFLQGLRELCDQQDILLIFDEVQCGMGRTGYPFAFQEYGIMPDAVSLAKGLGAGVPIGALLIGQRACGTFVPGDHASTFGGNLLAGAAASYMADKLADPSFMDQVRKASTGLTEMLEGLQKEFPHLIVEIRGKGLMLGIEMTSEAKPYIAKALDMGLLLVGAGLKVIRFVPPLVVTQQEIEQARVILSEAFRAVGSEA